MADDKNLPAAPRNELADFIDRLKDLDPVKMGQALDLWERGQNRHALAVYNDSMAEVQRRLEPIKQDLINKHLGNKYNSFAAVMKACEGPLKEEGITISFGSEPTNDPNVMRISCTLSKGFHSQREAIDWPVTVEGPRGGRPAMTESQARGSAITYARKELLEMILNLRPETSTDDDGNAGKNREPEVAALIAAFSELGVKPDQLATSRLSNDDLKEAYRDIKADKARITKWFPPTKGNAGLAAKLEAKLDKPEVPDEPDRLVDSDNPADSPTTLPSDEVSDLFPSDDPFGFTDNGDDNKPRLIAIRPTKKPGRGAGLDWENYADRMLEAIKACDEVEQLREVRITDNITFGLKTNAPTRFGAVLQAIASRERELNPPS